MSLESSKDVLKHNFWLICNASNASKVQAKPDTNSPDAKADNKEVVDIGFVTFFPTLDTTVVETAKNAE